MYCLLELQTLDLNYFSHSLFYFLFYFLFWDLELRLVIDSSFSYTTILNSSA